MIILGFDFGMKYLGVAVGQSITKTATPLTSLNTRDGIPNWDEIQMLIDTWKPDNLVVGIPLNMDGTKQEITFAAEKFIKRLHARFKLPVFPVDERLSTWEAKQRTQNDKKDKNKTDKKNFKKINAMAAAILVEQWMNDQK